jgi:hypothetical protein
MIRQTSNTFAQKIKQNLPKKFTVQKFPLLTKPKQTLKAHITAYKNSKIAMASIEKAPREITGNCRSGI